MKPLRIFIHEQVDPQNSRDLFSQLEALTHQEIIEWAQNVEEAHVAITNYPEDLPNPPKHILHIPLYSSVAGNFEVRLIHPDALLVKLIEFQQLLMRDKILQREDWRPICDFKDLHPTLAEALFLRIYML